MTAPARHLKVERDRAPVVLPHHHELAGPAADQPGGHRDSIAATTTRAGLSVAAELDTDTYPTGVRVSDAQLAALPLTRHDWHGDWSYILRPEPHPHLPVTAPDPFDQPSPDLASLCHPAVTGLPTTEWDTLITTLTSLHDHHREAELDKRRGHRPRKTRPGAGPRPLLTLADRFLATVLHDRLALPQTAVAALFGVRPETINRRIRDTRWSQAQSPRIKVAAVIDTEL